MRARACVHSRQYLWVCTCCLCLLYSHTFIVYDMTVLLFINLLFKHMVLMFVIFTLLNSSMFFIMLLFILYFSSFTTFSKSFVVHYFTTLYFWRMFFCVLYLFGTYSSLFFFLNHSTRFNNSDQSNKQHRGKNKNQKKVTF